MASSGVRQRQGDRAISRFDRVARLAVQMSVSPGWTVCEGPIGPLTVVAGPKGITNIHFSGHAPRLLEATRRPMRDVVEQVEAYFAGERQAFELDLDLRGTPLQSEVWRQLLEIPYGTTTTYGEVAGRIEEALYDPGLEPCKRPRVVGAAIGRNPVPVVVPCHRVIGADGSLTGYFGGLQRKQTLLDLESRSAARAPESARANHQLAMSI
jgi:methylated-DNA-[protein]-cysteine S-methyltransferase